MIGDDKVSEDDKMMFLGSFLPFLFIEVVTRKTVLMIRRKKKLYKN